jgi:hypothetical protein
LALDAERVAQADVQPVGEHDKARGNDPIVGKHDFLPVPAGCDRHRLGKDRFHAGRDLGPDRVDQRVVHDAELRARRLVEQVAEARDPSVAGIGRLAQHGLRDSRLAKTRDLLVAQLLDPEICWIGGMRIDQDGANARATEHRSRGRAGQTSAHDGNVGVVRHIALPESPDHCAQKAK